MSRVNPNRRCLVDCYDFPTSEMLTAYIEALEGLARQGGFRFSSRMAPAPSLMVAIHLDNRRNWDHGIHIVGRGRCERFILLLDPFAPGCGVRRCSAIFGAFRSLAAQFQAKLKASVNRTNVDRYLQANPAAVLPP